MVGSALLVKGSSGNYSIHHNYTERTVSLRPRDAHVPTTSHGREEERDETRRVLWEGEEGEEGFGRKERTQGRMGDGTDVVCLSPQRL